MRRFRQIKDTGSPEIFLPIAKGTTASEFLYLELDNSSLSVTSDVSSLGISIPIAAFPGIGASIRMEEAARFRAISSLRFTILLTLTPLLGCSSYRVMVGPRLTRVTVVSTPKTTQCFFKHFSLFYDFTSVSTIVLRY